MAMSVGDAHCVNLLLDYLLELPGASGAPVPSETARRSAAWLADRAYKVIYAGLSGEKVTAAWEGKPGENMPENMPPDGGDRS